MAQSYKFSVDEKLPLRFVNLCNNFLNHTISCVMSPVPPRWRGSRRKMYPNLMSEWYFDSSHSLLLHIFQVQIISDASHHHQTQSQSYSIAHSRGDDPIGPTCPSNLTHLSPLCPQTKACSIFCPLKAPCS